MKNLRRPGFVGLFLLFVVLLLTACGGGGGGGSSSTDGGGGGDSVNFDGQIRITGGRLVSEISAGVQDIVVEDQSGARFTIPNVNSPGSILRLPVVVVKAGSKFINGEYSSNTATYIHPSGEFSPLALSENGEVLEDFVMPTGGAIRLPVNKIGKYTFPNGILVAVPAFLDRVEMVDLSFTGSSNMNERMAMTVFTFTGSGLATGSLSLKFEGSALVSVQPGSNGLSPYTANGFTTGTSTEFPTAGISYSYFSN